MSYQKIGIHKQYQQQADATLNQANPVSGTEYTVLAETPHCKIHSAIISVTWTVQPTPLELHVYIDGKSINCSAANPASATTYYASIAPSDADADEDLVLVAALTTYGTIIVPHIFEGSTVRVTAETTGGTTSNLSARIKYARRAY